jgi:hypothetical protein
MPVRYKVGNRIHISLNNQILDAVIRAVVEQTDGLRLQVDFGNEQTALIHEWQVLPFQSEMMRRRISDVSRWVLGQRNIALLFFVSGIALVALPQVQDAPIDDQLKIKQKQLYGEAQSYIEESPTKLKKTVRELKGLESAPSQDSSSGLLSEIGAEADELLRRMPDLISDEVVTERIVEVAETAAPACTGINCSFANNSATKTTKFNYMILRHAGEHQGFLFEEYRSGRNGKALPADSESVRFRGFVATWVIFSSSNQVESHFRYLGQQQMNGHNTFVIGFAQIPGLVESPGEIVSIGGSIPMLLQGIAWIDKSDFRIVRLRTDLLAPRPEVGLQKQTAKIEFGPVQIIATTTMDLWLPYAVEIEMESPDRLVFEQHKYSGYRLYQVKSKMLSPKN